ERDSALVRDTNDRLHLLDARRGDGRGSDALLGLAPEDRIEIAIGIEVLGLGEDPFVAHDRAHFGERVRKNGFAHTRRYSHGPDASSSDTVVGADCTGPGAWRRGAS